VVLFAAPVDLLQRSNIN